MANPTNDRALAALLALEADEPNSPETDEKAHAQFLPALDERVELFLRAVYGGRDSFTEAERASARQQILNAIAADIADKSNDETLANGAHAVVGVGPAQVSTSATTRAPARRARRSLGDQVLDALQRWLLMPTFAGGPARLAAASFVTLLVAGVAWSAAWFYAARTAETAIANWIDWEARSGRVYDCGSRTIVGFPFRVELTCADPKVTIASEQSTLVVNAKELRAVASIFRADVLTAEIAGPISVADSGQARFQGNWTRARTTLRGTPANPDQISVVFDSLQFYRVTQSSMEPLFAGEQLDLNASFSPSSATGKFDVKIAAHVTGGSIAAGGPITSEPLTAEVTAALHDVGTATPMILSAQLREWQAAGGRLEMTRAQVRQGEALATGAGTIALNNGGRVEGRLQMTATGAYAQLAQSLIDRERNSAQTLLDGQRPLTRSLGNPDAQSRRQPNAAPPGQVELSIRFSDGAVFLGPAQLGVIPPLF
jgi:hypothetical protein